MLFAGLSWLVLMQVLCTKCSEFMSAMTTSCPGDIISCTPSYLPAWIVFLPLPQCYPSLVGDDIDISLELRAQQSRLLHTLVSIESVQSAVYCRKSVLWLRLRTALIYG